MNLDDYLPGEHGDPTPISRAPSAAWVSLEPGAVLFERYELRERVGRGGMGQVFRAKDRSLEKEVAVKVLHPTHSGDDRYEGLLRKESQILASLPHPGIVPVHEFRRQDGLSVIVMDLIHGTDLEAALQKIRGRLEARGRAPVPTDKDGGLLGEILGEESPAGVPDLLEPDSWFRSVARLTMEIARTLEAAHAEGVIHRDLTPRNVMLRQGGTPVLLDFGLAGSFKRSGTVTENLFGTPAHLAPEQVEESRSGSDPRTDLYQLGLVLYELTTLRQAYRGSHVQVLRRISQGDFASPRSLNRGIPKSLEAITLRAMERDPGSRYGTATEFRDDLDRFLHGLAPRAGGVSPLGRAARRARLELRKRPGLALAMGALLVLTSMGIVFFGSDRIDPLRVQSAWRVPFRGSAPAEISSSNPISPDDLLGVVVEAKQEALVYGLAVHGSPSSKDQYLEPIVPCLLLDQVQQLESVRVGNWGLSVPEGRSDVSFGRMGGGFDGHGLIVIVSLQPLPVMESWLDRLSERADQLEVTPGVPRPQAQRLFPAGPDDVPRGELTPEELARHLEYLSPEAVLKGEAWDSRLGKRFEFWFSAE